MAVLGGPAPESAGSTIRFRSCFADVALRRVILDRHPPTHEAPRMSAAKKLVRILAARSGDSIELAFATADGDTVKVLASEDQIDQLVDELEDILNSPADND
ncbi:hypothetical protein [Methylobacterium brachythecii]|uniref:Uncharacterized protein n=1 Tax=Methylobacterium brachythecii TaxID=1176177 RepID=A0A7W6AKS5_9HYPH|nr:hypothetical protein [Methylobacterium brachythecii]MBB3902611.1 hypothetical protein [Methylobacterium brachythecii]GLS42455.1 hypothetical protein GCM10007884_04400 [Methylobacterium brachythecii]